MKIGIFGDSFANFRRIKNSSLDWVQILGTKYSITNYGEKASSFYFSADNFLKHHKNFDKVIFCITGCGRLYLPEHSAYTQIVPNFGPKSSRHAYPSIGELKSEELADQKSIEIVNAVKSYYMYIENLSERAYFQQCAVRDLRRIRPDGLFFENELWDVSFAEDEFYLKGKNRNDYFDNRHCHLSVENNKRLAELVDEWIKNPSVSFNLDQFILPPTTPFEEHFIPVQDLS